MGFFVWSGMGGSASGMSLPASTTPDTIAKTLSVRLTGYNAVPEQTDSTPDTTATGAYSNPAVIAARSPDLGDALPYGTIIEIIESNKDTNCGFSLVDNLIGYRVIADSTNEHRHSQIDLLFNEADTVLVGGKPTNPALVLGVCEATIRAVGKIAIKDIPETQSALALLVNHKVAVR